MHTADRGAQDRDDLAAIRGWEGRLVFLDDFCLTEVFLDSAEDGPVSLLPSRPLRSSEKAPIPSFSLSFSLTHTHSHHRILTGRTIHAQSPSSQFYKYLSGLEGDADRAGQAWGVL